ncbi:MAG: hypothetical protein ACI92Z_001227 [Paracoccaceae bacterium]|jgi:hypothetical protein
MATQAQINTVLGGISAVHIRGVFITGADTGGLDNVKMSAKYAHVRLLSDAPSGTLISNHGTLDYAVTRAAPGNVIVINNVLGRHCLITISQL